MSIFYHDIINNYNLLVKINIKRNEREKKLSSKTLLSLNLLSKIKFILSKKIIKGESDVNIKR